jgi:hypothetical protein
MAKGVDEDNLIKVQRKNGIAEPILTEDQENVAKDFVRTQIEVGVGGTEKMTTPWKLNAPRVSRGGGSGGGTKKPTQSDQNLKYLFDSTSSIMQDVIANGINSEYAKDILNNLQDDYELLQGSTIKKNASGGVDVFNEKKVKVYSINNLVDFYSVLNKKNKAQSKADYTRYIQLTQGGGAPAPAKTTPAKTTPVKKTPAKTTPKKGKYD